MVFSLYGRSTNRHAQKLIRAEDFVSMSSIDTVPVLEQAISKAIDQDPGVWRLLHKNRHHKSPVFSIFIPSVWSLRSGTMQSVTLN